jgi:hypothetical protein
MGAVTELPFESPCDSNGTTPIGAPHHFCPLAQRTGIPQALSTKKKRIPVSFLALLVTPYKSIEW